VSRTFRVGITRDVRTPDGGCYYALDALSEAADITWDFIAEDRAELTAADVDGLDAVVVFASRVSAATLAGPNPPLLFARLGVGYDSVDVAACTARGALVTTSPESVRRPIAAAAMAFVLALAHRVVEKDRMVRADEWERFASIGAGLAGRTLGVLGLGGIGRELCGLAEPFFGRRIAADPYAAPLDGVEPVNLETLLRTSDFLCITCPLTDETRGLIDAGRLAQMKPGAYLVNVARGRIVDQRALATALAERRLAGAALDVFEREPIARDDPLLELQNVLLSPHGIGRTDELLAASGHSVCESILAVVAGRAPRFVVDAAALEHPRLREVLQA